MKRAITAVFADRDTANDAIHQLLAIGFTGESISMIMTPKTRELAYPSGDETDAVAWGAGLGAIVGGLTIIAAGPVGLVASGPILALLAGGAVGAATGGLLGALVELGLPEEQAKIFAKEVESGNIVLAVECRSEEAATRAQKVLAEHAVNRQDSVYVAQSA